MRIPISKLLVLVALFLLTGFDDEDLQREQVSQREDIRLLKEKIAQVENDSRAAQVQNETLKTEIGKLKTELGALQEIRKDIERLNGLIQKLDAAREKDRKTIVEEVAREIARLHKESSTAGKGKSQKTPPKSTTEVGVEHIVKKGEYLAAIAEAYQVSIQAIKEANQLKSNELKVGQKLFIPAKK